MCILCFDVCIYSIVEFRETGGALVALSLKGAHNYIIWLRDLFLYILLFAYNVLMNLYCFHAI